MSGHPGIRRAISAAFRRLIEDRRGAAAMIAALSFPVLVGMAGLAVDASFWAMQKRQAQGAADQAAYSAAVATINGGDATTEARAVAAGMGFVDGVGGVTVALNTPPTSGAYAGQANAWEVKISQPQQRWFSSLFLANSPTVGARAVAMRGASGCILGLDPSAPNAVQFDNNASLNTGSCAVYSNSSSPSALSCANNCVIESPTYVVGGENVANNGHLNGSPNVTGAAPISDPYATVDAGAAGPCTRTTVVTGGAISPGHYCGGILVQNNATLSMASGVYYIDQQFGVQNNGILNANPPAGVTIIINGTYCIGTGTCQQESGLGNNATLNITAQTSGPYAGIAIMGPRNSSPSVRQEISNNSVLNIQGALYFPSQTLDIRNNANFNTSLCAQVIADILHFENNANMGTNCTGTGVASIGAKVRMVE